MTKKENLANFAATFKNALSIDALLTIQYCLNSNELSLWPEEMHEHNMVMHHHGNLAMTNQIDISELPILDQITYTLQQDIFDNEFVAGNIENVAGISFEAHKAFPGEVSGNPTRITGAQISINASNISDPGYALTHELRGVSRPTGYYAVPGEVVTITVDPSFVNQVCTC